MFCFVLFLWNDLKGAKIFDFKNLSAFLKEYEKEFGTLKDAKDCYRHERMTLLGGELYDREDSWAELGRVIADRMVHFVKHENKDESLDRNNHPMSCIVGCMGSGKTTLQGALYKYISNSFSDDEKLFESCFKEDLYQDIFFDDDDKIDNKIIEKVKKLCRQFMGIRVTYQENKPAHYDYVYSLDETTPPVSKSEVKEGKEEKRKDNDNSNNGNNSDNSNNS